MPLPKQQGFLTPTCEENTANSIVKLEIKSELSNSDDDHSFTGELEVDVKSECNLSSSEDDEEAELLTEDVEEQFLKVLSRLKKKDPELYKEDITYYSSQEPGTSGSKGEKGFKKYRTWLKGKNHAKGSNELTSDLEALHDFWTNPSISKDDQFLRDYILNKKFLDCDENFSLEKELAKLDQEEEELNEELLFENKFNHRFEEEPDITFINKYPRTMSALGKKKKNNKLLKVEQKELIPHKKLTTSNIKVFTPQPTKPASEKNGVMKKGGGKGKQMPEKLGKPKIKVFTPQPSKSVPEKNGVMKKGGGKGEGNQMPEKLAKPEQKQLLLKKSPAELALKGEMRKKKLRHRVKKIKEKKLLTAGATTGIVNAKNQKLPKNKSEINPTFVKEKKQKLQKQYAVKKKQARVRSKKGPKPVRA